MIANDMALSRRGLLAAGMGLTAASLVLPKAALAVPASGERALSFYNTHTAERVKTVYWADGNYVPEGLAQANKVLRDFRTGEVHPIDPELFDLLHRAQMLTEAKGRTFEIISGYRSPKTNAMLNSKSHGVAKKSQHMLGKAMDVRLQGVQLDQLRKAALALKGGGVGYYPESNFVHMDTGRVRFW